MAFAKSLVAPPAKRLMAALIDISVVVCAGWFFASAITSDWYPYALLTWTIPAVYWIYETSCLVSWKGSSLGRNLFDIQVVSSTGNYDLALWQAVIRPASRIAYYAGFLAYLRPAPVHQLDVALYPFVLELVLLYMPWGVTLADLVARTRVINTPPPQPHRAPAGPMYSATDAEFGHRPSRHPNDSRH